MSERNSRSLRVIHVTTSHNADDVRIYERECRSLIAAGDYEVSLIAHGVLSTNCGVNLMALGELPVGRVARFTRGPVKSQLLTHALDFDIWHFHDPELLPVAIRLGNRGKCVIWDAHEDYASQFNSQSAKHWVPGLLRPMVSKAMRQLLASIDRNAAAIVAATPTIAARYQNPRTIVVGNEARLEDFATCNPVSSSRQLLFTGSPSQEHCFNEIIEAVEQIPEVTLAVAGKNPSKEVWDFAISRLGNRVTHLGWLDRAGVSQAIDSSFLGLVTYSDSPVHQTNAGNKLFEFAAAGLPVLATPTRSNIEFLRKGASGIVSDGFSALSIRNAITQALDNEASWNEWSINGRVWAQKEGSWEKSEKELLDLYKQLAGDILSETDSTYERG